MSNTGLKQRIKDIPVAILPAMVGACTLGNVFQSLGFYWIKNITFFVAAIIWILYIAKIITNFETCKNEYSNTVPASLYAGFTMLLMLLGSFVFTWSQFIGKTMWFVGLILHAIHILIFTYKNVIKGVKIATFVPSWFVTYNGIMVSAVIGGVMKEPTICKIVVYYGITVLIIIMPFMIYRLIKHPINDPLFHTQAILLAPSSLCLVSYFNFFNEPNKYVVYPLYILILLTLIFIIYKIPKFFSYSFNPGFAGLTFPMAIGIVASTKMSAYLASVELERYSNWVKQISGVQIYLTTVFIGFVIYNLLKIVYKLFSPAKE